MTARRKYGLTLLSAGWKPTDLTREPRSSYGALDRPGRASGKPSTVQSWRCECGRLVQHGAGMCAIGHPAPWMVEPPNPFLGDLDDDELQYPKGE